MDLAVAEVADQKVAAHGRPACRREGDPPRSVEVAPGGDAVQERAAQVVDIDDPSAISVDLVALGSLDAVGDEDARPDRLDAERREALREVRVDEMTRIRGDEMPGPVEYVDVDGTTVPGFVAS